MTPGTRYTKEGSSEVFTFATLLPGGVDGCCDFCGKHLYKLKKIYAFDVTGETGADHGSVVIGSNCVKKLKVKK